jgi:cell division septal protein FtsQ
MKQRTKAAIVLVLLFASLTYLFAFSPVFQVKKISVLGTPKGVSQSLILETAQIAIGDKLARIEPRTVSTRLSTLNWISAIKLERNWFRGAIELKITPRIPVGIYRGRALDKSGTLFDLPSGKPSDLPEVRASNPQLGLLAIELFKELPGDLRNSLVSMNANHESSIASVHQRGSREIKIQWGSSEDMALKVKVYRALLELPENKEITMVDLSAPHAPIVK